MTTTPEPTFDALLPPAMAAKAEQIGVNEIVLGWIYMTESSNPSMASGSC